MIVLIFKQYNIPSASPRVNVNTHQSNTSIPSQWLRLPFTIIILHVFFFLTKPFSAAHKCLPKHIIVHTLSDAIPTYNKAINFPIHVVKCISQLQICKFIFFGINSTKSMKINFEYALVLSISSLFGSTSTSLL